MAHNEIQAAGSVAILVDRRISRFACIQGAAGDSVLEFVVVHPNGSMTFLGFGNPNQKLLFLVKIYGDGAG